MLETVLSVDGSPYLAWQAELLTATHAANGVPGTLTQLLAEPGASGHSRVYPPFNKPRSLAAWITGDGPSGDPILLLDPDCVFVSAPDGTMAGGQPIAPLAARQPIAQPAPYLDPWEHRDLLARHGVAPESAQAIGTPAVIGRDELAALAPAWLARTCDILEDRWSRQRAGWVAEMWGYVIAAAQLGLHHVVAPLAHGVGDDRIDRPLIHYCDALVAHNGVVVWDKRGYVPWATPPTLGGAAPLAGATLLELLAEYAASQTEVGAAGPARVRPPG